MVATAYPERIEAEKHDGRFTSGPAIVLYLAFAKLLLHLLTAARYGIFRDEMYYVARGRARMRAGSEDQAVSEGSIIFVAAGVEHRFYDITEELVVLVFFAPAESA